MSAFCESLLFFPDPFSIPMLKTGTQLGTLAGGFQTILAGVAAVKIMDGSFGRKGTATLHVVSNELVAFEIRSPIPGKSCRLKPNAIKTVEALTQDSESHGASSVVGGAVLGGLVAGSVGAIVGGMAAQSVQSTYSVKVTLAGGRYLLATCSGEEHRQLVVGSMSSNKIKERDWTFLEEKTPTGSSQEMTLSCPRCDGVFVGDPQLAGETVTCPHCSRQFKMPEPKAVKPASRIVACPHCNVQMRIALEQSGEVVRCSSCSGRLRAP